MRDNRQVLLCALCATACGGQGEPLLASAARPLAQSVAFTSELWPGEGIPVIELQRVVLPVHAEPDPESAVVDSLRGRVGQRVKFDSTRYQTLTTGLITPHRPFTLRGRNLGDVRQLAPDEYYRSDAPEISLPVSPVDTIDFLQYRAEGTCFVRYQGHVIDAQPCPGFGRESVTVVRDPVTRWWIHVRGTGGVSGWVHVSDTTARPVRREF